MNAHIFKCEKKNHYRHFELQKTINPQERLAKSQVSARIFDRYINLEALSRKARYLYWDAGGGRMVDALYTNENDFEQAIVHLDRIMQYFVKRYPKTDFPVREIVGEKLTELQTAYFRLA